MHGRGAGVKNFLDQELQSYVNGFRRLDPVGPQSVLAYQFVQFLRTRLKSQGIRESWANLRRPSPFSGGAP
jgi:hypothetical protein